jgi:hypothetical protein
MSCPTSMIPSTGVIERQKLALCRKASRTRRPRMLKVAADYEKLAKRAEERRAGMSQSVRRPSWSRTLSR